MDQFTFWLAFAMWASIALSLWASDSMEESDVSYVQVMSVGCAFVLNVVTAIVATVICLMLADDLSLLPHAIALSFTAAASWIAFQKGNEIVIRLAHARKFLVAKITEVLKARADRRLASAQYREDVREEKRRSREKRKALQPRMAKRAMRAALAKCRAAAQDEPDVFEGLLDSMGLLASMTGSTESQLARLVRRAQKLERYIKLLKKDAVSVSESLQRMVDRLGETHDLINEIVQTVSATAPIICEIVCDLPGARREDAISKLDDLVGKYAELYARCVAILGESVDGLLNGEQTETHPELRSLLARTSSTPHDISPRLDDLIRESARPSTPSSKAITKS